MTDQSAEAVNDVPKQQPLWPILTSIFTAAIALGALFIGLDAKSNDRLEDFRAQLLIYHQEAAADRRAFQAEGAADRRASEDRMDEFRREMDEFRSEMLRLSGRQSHLEGVQEGQVSASTAGS